MMRFFLIIRSRLSVVLAACVVVGLAGCQTIDFYDPSLEDPVALDDQMPKEKALMSLPAYRIAPPDVLQIEMLKLIPLSPYRVEIFDVLTIQVVGTLLDQPINNYYLVEGEGTVDLGPAYGKVRVAGMTVEEIKEAIDQELSKILANPVASVQLARTAGTQPVSGEYLVGPDGTVNLRQYGAVHVAGKTIAQTKVELEKHLSQYLDSPQVAIDVLAYNSKVYYVITEGGGLGDNVLRVPVTGKETVLDAISNIGGMSEVSSKDIWIARLAPNDFGCEQILPIDWDAITRGASSATNYQIMPGDRVFVAENGVIAMTNFINILAGPFERVAGMASLGASTFRQFQTTGRSYNRLRQN